jgi:hypothetical protein
MDVPLAACTPPSNWMAVVIKSIYSTGLALFGRIPLVRRQLHVARCRREPSLGLPAPALPSVAAADRKTEPRTGLRVHPPQVVRRSSGVAGQ